MKAHRTAKKARQVNVSVRACASTRTSTRVSGKSVTITDTTKMNAEDKAAYIAQYTASK